jgi:hypothetical protein
VREFEDGWVPFIPAGDENLSRRARVRAVFADLYWSRGHSLRWLAAPVVGFALINLGLLVYAADKDRVGQQAYEAYEATGTQPNSASLARTGAALESLGRRPTGEPSVSTSDPASTTGGSALPVAPTTATDPAGPLLAAPAPGLPTTATPTTATPTTATPTTVTPTTVTPTTVTPTTVTPTTATPTTATPSTEAPSALVPVTEVPTTEAPTTLTPTTRPPTTRVSTTLTPSTLTPTTLTPTTTRRGSSDESPGHNKDTRKGRD